MVLLIALIAALVVVINMLPVNKPAPRVACWTQWSAPIEADSGKALRQYIETIQFHGLQFGAKV